MVPLNNKMTKYRLSFIVIAVLLCASTLSLASEDMEHEHDHSSSFSLFSMVKPLGIATLISVFTTFLSGVFRRKLGHKWLKIHISLAVITLVLGSTHGLLVIILYG